MIDVPTNWGAFLEARNPQNHRAFFRLGQAHGNKKFDLGPIAYPHLVGAQPCEMLGIPWVFFLWNKIFDRIVETKEALNRIGESKTRLMESG